MTTKVIYTQKAISNLKQLDNNLAKKIINKIAYYCSQENFIKHTKKLSNFSTPTYRFRIGNYRAIFEIGQNNEIQILYILSIGHRKEVYKRL